MALIWAARSLTKAAQSALISRSSRLILAILLKGTIRCNLSGFFRSSARFRSNSSSNFFLAWKGTLLFRDPHMFRMMETRISSLPNCSTVPPISFLRTLLTKTKFLSSGGSMPRPRSSFLMVSRRVIPSGSSLFLQWVRAMVRWFFSRSSWPMMSSSKSSIRADLALRQKMMVLNQSLICFLSWSAMAAKMVFFHWSAFWALGSRPQVS